MPCEPQRGMVIEVEGNSCLTHYVLNRIESRHPEAHLAGEESKLLSEIKMVKLALRDA